MHRLEITLSFSVLAITSTVRAGTPLEYGMDMSARAYGAVCWYENLKQFPKFNLDNYSNCSDQVQSQKRRVLDSSPEDYSDIPGKQEGAFGSWVAEAAFGPESGIPIQYSQICGSFLKDSKASSSIDEGDAVNDGGKDYPYKGFAYCLMNALRQKHGDKAIEAVKGELTHSKKDWRQTILDRDNELRTYHGAPQFTMVKELNDAAQAYAEDLASKCTMKHSKNSDPGRQWNDASTGENLMGGDEKDKTIAAYTTSEGWYSEIKNYPFPQGYDGSDDQLFYKIGHFTQQIWKGSKYVGYGYAYNPECGKRSEMSMYVVGRYSPPGNYPGEYPGNVSPPKN